MAGAHQEGTKRAGALAQTEDATRAWSPAQVARALRSAEFPGGTASLEVIETHRSWVFLTGDRAYKLRKLPDNGSSTRARLLSRRRDSERELSLNLRLAASVYLGVVPVVVSPAGLRVGGAGEVVDWVLEMRRLPKSRMLDTCIQENTVRPLEVDALAALLSDFYQRCERAPLEPREYCERLEEEITAKGASLEAEAYGLDRRLVRAVVERQRAWMNGGARRLAMRARAVVDAHGDLRPEHICLEATPVVIDCLDFDRSLRLLDPVSELAFLLLECRRLGAPWVGERVLELRSALAGDLVPSDLVGFYQGVHALIRAALAIWHLDDAPEQAARWRDRAHHYLRLATEL